ncbi:hypothetical protein [Candidatus Pantoea formicae]|uniref:hypothetical protein n=1 Tax=Candidatus Pantoea formicae TaxID=2608355 RepID=UPI003EDA2039
MNKNKVLEILKKALLAIREEEILYNKVKLKDIEHKYVKVISSIENDTLTYNEINNSVKAYLEVYNDYDNPLLYEMSDAEEAVSEYLN